MTNGVTLKASSSSYGAATQSLRKRTMFTTTNHETRRIFHSLPYISLHNWFSYQSLIPARVRPAYSTVLWRESENQVLQIREVIISVQTSFSFLFLALRFWTIMVVTDVEISEEDIDFCWLILWGLLKDDDVWSNLMKIEELWKSRLKSCSLWFDILCEIVRSGSKELWENVKMMIVVVILSQDWTTMMMDYWIVSVNYGTVQTSVREPWWWFNGDEEDEGF